MTFGLNRLWAASGYCLNYFVLKPSEWKSELDQASLSVIIWELGRTQKENNDCVLSKDKPYLRGRECITSTIFRLNTLEMPTSHCI